MYLFVIFKRMLKMRERKKERERERERERENIVTIKTNNSTIIDTLNLLISYLMCYASLKN